MRNKPRTNFERIALAGLVMGLAAFPGCRHKKYENPISNNTDQPDKILFDKAVGDIQHGRYDVARLTLHTLISTYDTSEYLAKAKLAIADSWFREGNSNGMAQAEAEYRDFILFYPMMEESPEAQMKICDIQIRQMEKADRDTLHAFRAETECRAVLEQFPNSKFAPEAQQKLRNIQETIADHEYRVGSFYMQKGSYPAGANRLQGLTDHYPLFSKADDSLWKLGDAYAHMGPRFRDQSAEAFARLVRDYPLSPLVEVAKKRLEQMEKPIPEADPVAVARMKYEQENYDKPGMMSHFWGMFRKSPDISAAAKSGTPAMTTLQPTIPASVPPPAVRAGAGGPTADVSASTLTGPSALDTQPDARPNQAQPQEAAQAQAAAAPQSNAPLPTNRKAPIKVKQKKPKKQKNQKNQPQDQQNQPTPTTGTPTN